MANIIKTSKQAEFIAYLESQENPAYWYLYLRIHSRYVRVRFEDGELKVIEFQQRGHLVEDIANCNRIHAFTTALSINDIPFTVDDLRRYAAQVVTTMLTGKLQEAYREQA